MCESCSSYDATCECFVCHRDICDSCNKSTDVGCFAICKACVEEREKLLTFSAARGICLSVNRFLS